MNTATECQLDEGSSRRDKRSLAFVFSFAIAIQIIFLLLLPKSALVNDSTDFVKYYNPVALNLLSGKGLVLDSGEFGTLYPAGFPAFLAGSYFVADLFGLDRLHLVVAMNVFLMAIGSVIVFLTAKELFTPRIAACSSVLWITYIFNLWLIKQPNSEVPFIPLLLAAVYCLIRGTGRNDLRWIACSGLLLGLAALVRPIALMLPLLLAFLALLDRRTALNRRLAAAAIVIAAFALAVLPWEVDVYHHTGRIVPLSTNGASSILDGVTFARRSGTAGIPGPALQLMRRIAHHGPELRTPGQIFTYLGSEATNNPQPVVELFLLKIARSWFGTDSGSHERVTLIVQSFYAVLSTIGFVLMARRFPERRYFLVICLAIVLYFWGMAVVALSILRYLIPAMSYLLIPAAAVPAALLERRSGSASQSPRPHSTPLVSS